MNHFYRELNHNQIIKGLLLILASLLILAVFLSRKAFLEGQFRNREGGRIYIDSIAIATFKSAWTRKPTTQPFQVLFVFTWSSYPWSLSSVTFWFSKVTDSLFVFVAETLWKLSFVWAFCLSFWGLWPCMEHALKTTWRIPCLLSHVQVSVPLYWWKQRLLFVFCCSIHLKLSFGT